MSARIISADIVRPSNKGFTDLKTILNQIRKTIIHIIRILPFKVN